MNDPILTPDISRFTIFPVRYPVVSDNLLVLVTLRLLNVATKLWGAYKQCLLSFWTAEEVMRHSAMDSVHWTSELNDDERSFLSMILAFFAASDGIVAENLAQQFFSEVQIPEARCFYGVQIMMYVCLQLVKAMLLNFFRENIHAETYGHFIRLFGSTIGEQDRLFRAIETVPTIQAKAQWCFRWFNRSERSFASRLVAFAIVEGVFFCSSFAAIYWFRQRGILPGLCFSNELIARDENMHMRFACLLYSELQVKLPRAEIYAMVIEAVSLEKAFFSGEYAHPPLTRVADQHCVAALRTPFVGLNADMMADYIECVADSLLAYLDVPPYYRNLNPVSNLYVYRAIKDVW